MYVYILSEIKLYYYYYYRGIIELPFFFTSNPRVSVVSNYQYKLCKYGNESAHGDIVVPTCQIPAYDCARKQEVIESIVLNLLKKPRSYFNKLDNHITMCACVHVCMCTCVRACVFAFVST